MLDLFDETIAPKVKEVVKRFDEIRSKRGENAAESLQHGEWW